MIDPETIKKDMPVIASDGERIGEVDGVEGGDRIKLKRTTSPDGVHHYVPMGDVARIDEHVHLSLPASEIRSGWMTAAGTAGLGAAATASAAPSASATTTQTRTVDHGAHDVRVEDNRDKSWLPWILGALALLALLIFGLRSCDDTQRTEAVPVGDNVVAEDTVDADVDVAVEEQSVVLPGGATVMLAPQTIGYDLQRYLASTDAVPRTFQFERLNFDTAKADIRAIDRPTVDGLGQILKAYPDSRVRVVGYADARGDAGTNANLGLNRARSVAAALTAAGVAANRVETATGGETNPDETNATNEGQFENRRTELIVLDK